MPFTFHNLNYFFFDSGSKETWGRKMLDTSNNNIYLVYLVKQINQKKLLGAFSNNVVNPQTLLLISTSTDNWTEKI